MLFIFKSKGAVIIFKHSHGECRWNQIRHAVRMRHYDIAAADEMGLGAKMLIQDNLSLAIMIGFRTDSAELLQTRSASF